MSTTLTIPYSSIVEGERIRNKGKYGDLGHLKASLARLGTIHPIILVALPDGRYELVAGGRRYRALGELGVTELHHGSVLIPGRYGFLFQDEMPKHVLKEAELDENLQRLDMDWIDTALAIADIHILKKGSDKNWGTEQTALLLGYTTYQRRKVEYAVMMAKAIRSGDTEILKCPHFTAAVAYLLKKNEDKALAELQKRNAARQNSTPSTFSFLDNVNMTLQPTKKPEPAVESAPVISESVTTTQTAIPSITVPLSRQFVLGDFRDVMQGEAYVDHIVTDIPYGIDMDNLDIEMVRDVKDQHDVEQNVSMMPEFLGRAFAALKPGGFCVFFYDLDHHEKLQAWALAAGFKVQRWPYIACKSSPCRNNAPSYNLTKNFEVCMFLRKDEKTVLRKPGLPSFGTYDFAAERKIYNNPFAKPFLLWKFIYDAIAFPGQSILDPFCGEMSAGRAAANCGLVPFGIEINPIHYNRGLEHMKAVYATIHGTNVKFE